MKQVAALTLYFSAASALAAPFPDGNAQAGKKLFDGNKCNSCHINKVGGDGSAIFIRPNRIVHNPQQLVERLHVCGEAAGITLIQQDEQNLGAYLNQYYKFK